MTQVIETLTAKAEHGRWAIQEVMRHSYAADVENVPAAWARVRVADGVPVSFIVVDPNRWIEFPGGDLRYAFICDVATREDRRGEGHFRGIMEEAFSSLRAAGIPLVLTHGRYQLYRRFGFDVFTHHCGIFATPELIERRLGIGDSEAAEQLLTVEDRAHIQADLLLVTDVKARALPECRVALQAAAALARRRGKARILFEHPAAPSYGSRYPIHPSWETPFTALARACGAQVGVQGADPEGGPVPDADWIKVLDAAAFLKGAVECLGETDRPLPEGVIGLETDVGQVTIESSEGGMAVLGDLRRGAERVKWPSSVLAQLVTGYQPVEVLNVIHGISLSDEAMALLSTLFPPRWRFSRNESWTFAW